LEQAHGLVTKAKLLAFKEKEAATLLSKSHPLESQILLLIKSLKEAKKMQVCTKEFWVDGCIISDLIVSTLKPTSHPTLKTTQVTTLTI
jgi:hypothetical protein